MHTEFSWGNLLKKRIIERPEWTWEDNIKQDLKQACYEGGWNRLRIVSNVEPLDSTANNANSASSVNSCMILLMIIFLWYSWLTKFSFVMLDGKMLYFTSAAINRQLLEVFIKEIKVSQYFSFHGWSCEGVLEFRWNYFVKLLLEIQHEIKENCGSLPVLAKFDVRPIRHFANVSSVFLFFPHATEDIWSYRHGCLSYYSLRWAVSSILTLNSIWFTSHYR
jgi:hypothetical protein